MLRFFAWVMEMGGILLSLAMLFDEGQDHIQGRYIAFVAVLFASSAAFFALAIWEDNRNGLHGQACCCTGKS